VKINSVRGHQGMSWLTESPIVAEFATERDVLQRFVLPAFHAP
jgi:hypothetical protein